MAEKWLFEIEGRAYAYAETEAKAIRAVQDEASLHDIPFEASKTSSVDEDWADAIPYGGDDNRTCGQIQQAQREARDAAELAATPDPNQLALPIEVLASQYQRAVDQALQERDLREEVRR